ncbi:MAG TPA: GNAT family protein [Polyangiaceae bacterium]|jgi:ribosomal-protein-alanine N-acetyltransferase
MARKVGSTGRVYLEACSKRRSREFLLRVTQSQKLHRPWLAAPSTRTAFAAFVKRSQDVNRRSYFVCIAETRELAGVINIGEIVRGLFQSGYLGYYAFEPFSRQGYLSEGLALVLDEAFGELGLHRLEANIQPDNQASRRLVKRLGFRREGFSKRYLKIAGRWRDHERWAILAEEWRTRDKRSRHAGR